MKPNCAMRLNLYLERPHRRLCKRTPQLAGAASAMKIFADINEAEAWLARPLDQIP
jgi:uncharacterized protein (DUF2384 family)